MKFDPPFACGTLVKRYKRFLADIVTTSGDEITIHCPNTGSMKNCLAPGKRVWYSDSNNPKRKYRHTWEIAETPDDHMAGVNTGRANALVEEAIINGVIPELQDYGSIRREVKYGQENSRIDLLLEQHAEDTRRCYVEVKNVTLHSADGQGLFPDSPSERGTKHLRELAEIARQGDRAVLFYCVQHSGIDRVSPAADIDPKYAQTLQQAIAEGLEVIAYQAQLSADQIVLQQALPFQYQPS